MKLLSLQKGLRRGNVESSISPYTKTIGLFGIARIELHLAFRDCRPQWNFLRICDALAERFRSEPLDSNRSVTGSRLVGSDLRAWHQVWTDYAQTGSISITLLCGIQIPMVVGFAEIIEREQSLVAGAGFEPAPFGL